MTSSEGKGVYRSTLRESQARATRRAIVDAAAALYVDRGYGATTIDAIAEAAGVSRKTVFTSVGGKAEALKLALDWAITGDDEPVALLERPQIQALSIDPDARHVLAGYAAVFMGIVDRIAPIAAVLQGAAGLDADLAALEAQRDADHLRGMTALTSRLVQLGALREDLTPVEAADVLTTIATADTYHRLVLERGWTPARFERWFTDILINTLIAADYQPGGTARVDG